MLILAEVNMQKQLLRSFRTNTNQELLGTFMQIDKQHIELPGHFSNRTGISLMGVVKAPLLIKTTANNGGEQNRRSVQCANIGNETTKIVGIGPICGGIALRRLHFGIVVPEFDKHIVAGRHFTQQRSPTALVNKTLGTSSVYGMIGYPYAILKI